MLLEPRQPQNRIFDSRIGSKESGSADVWSVNNQPLADLNSGVRCSPEDRVLEITLHTDGEKNAGSHKRPPASNKAAP